MEKKTTMPNETVKKMKKNKLRDFAIATQ